MKIFIIALCALYVSTILATIILCIKNKAKYLCFIAPLIPIFVIYLNTRLALKQLTLRKRSIDRNISRFMATCIYGITDFPIFIVFTVKILAVSTLNKRIEELISKLFNSSEIRIFFKSTIETYNNFFTNSMKKNSKEFIRIKYSS